MKKIVLRNDNNRGGTCAVAFLFCLLLITIGQVDGFVDVKWSAISKGSSSSSITNLRKNSYESTATRRYGAAVIKEEDPLTTIQSSSTNAFNNEQPNDDDEVNNNVVDWTKYWYPIMPLNYLDDDEDLETQARSMTILGQELSIWRSSSSTDNINNNSTTATHTYSVVADVCPHRRAALSSGKVRNGTLACRYHGWEFNSEGTCTKIPMMDTSCDSSTSSPKSSAFAVQSYPTAQNEGLLWVYMDPTDQNRPALPAATTTTSANGSGDSNHQCWNINVFPVSMQSMIENSFDPSHAPFIHEVMDYSKTRQASFGMFSPDNVVPMKEHETISNVTKFGFTLQHSPYHVSPMAPPGADKVMTTRQYIAPFTNVAKLPFGCIPLHFVPSRAGETLSFSGGMLAGPTMLPPILNRVPFVSRRLRTIIEEFIHFWSSCMATGPYRFITQDVQIMQSQDERKRVDMDDIKSSRKRSSWNDMYPTKSDYGVQTLQKWMSKFNKNGQRPDVTMPSKYGPRPLLSAWDRHAKYCPKCKRSLTRLSTIMNKSNQVSKWSLGGGFILTVVGQLVSAFALKRPTSMVWAVGWMALSISFASKALGQFCASTLDRVFASPTQRPELQMMDIYSR